MLNKDKYESIQFDHDFQKEKITNALLIVRNFIIRNRRILTGGMAIDMAMRSKGLKLYADDKLPDYDIYSPEFHIDAYNLGEELLAQGFQGISVIKGRHVSTMRVRVNFVTIADITYIPNNIYNRLPTIEHEQLLIIHPHYQMIDQHRALSLPFENPPFETVFFRWKKDLERYTILSDAFPLDDKHIVNHSGSAIDNNGRSIVNEHTMVKSCSIDKIKLLNNCLTGYAGFLYWVMAAKEEGFFIDEQEKYLSGELSIGEKITLKCKHDIPLSILSDDYLTVSKNPDNKFFNPIVDKIPKKIIIGDYEILANRGRLTSAYYDEKHEIWITNLQACMVYLLTMGLIYNKPWYISAYILSSKIIAWAIENKLHKYLPSVKTYGIKNNPEFYKIMKDDADQLLGKKERLYQTPKNAYPTETHHIKKELYTFNIKSSLLYQYDGEETNQFIYSSQLIGI